MTRIRTGRRRYYDHFARFYDAFIRLHARKERQATRSFLVDRAGLDTDTPARILDICCGTGDVILAFAENRSKDVLVGYDFSRQMLLEARVKDVGGRIRYVEGDAAELPFTKNSFDVVACSHALYELKRAARYRALREMRRVVRERGVVLLMEHEVPRRPIARFMFNLRMLSMGAEDAGEFLGGGCEPFEQVFAEVALTHSPSKRSKLLICRK
jgi:ubiquinone/menaquinone biosynthesis C-methylase UbiE